MNFLLQKVIIWLSYLFINKPKIIILYVFVNILFQSLSLRFISMQKDINQDLNSF